MDVLKRFFTATFKPFFLCTGAATALIGLYAFFPEWAVSQLAQLEYLRNYTIIVQHWGIMVGLMGLFMMGAAIVPAWRFPILVFSGIEKAFMVWVVLSNADQEFVRGFWIPAALDSTVVLYTVVYFLVMGFRVPIPDEKSSKM